jgi:protoporphyrinogen/coproporphyrinogen III oxidase
MHQTRWPFVLEAHMQTDRVVVIGAGLTGLTAAYRLCSSTKARPRPIEVMLLESRERVGGAIWTERVDDFILEGGADSFITNKPEALELCHELGLSGQLIGTDHRNRRSFVLRKGRLLPVPDGFVLMAPRRVTPLLTSSILSWRGKCRVLLEVMIPRRRDEVDESLASFVRRRLGREAFERLVQPLVAGIYTADPNDLSLRATLPQFVEMEARYGGLIRGAWAQGKLGESERSASGARYGLFASLADGMDTLPRTLAASLPPGVLRKESPVRRVSRAGAGWDVELLDGSTISARAVILAVEARAAARLIDGEDPELAVLLRSIQYASSAIVQVGYRREQVAHPLDGFGAVIPAIERRDLLAVSFTSVKFPSRSPEGTALFRCFYGGATRPDLFERDDDELSSLARRELGELLGASGVPLISKVDRHPLAMPQYTLGHIERVAKIRKREALLRGLTLAGNAFEGVGIPDCIRSGTRAAEQILSALDAAVPRAVA